MSYTRTPLPFLFALNVIALGLSVFVVSFFYGGRLDQSGFFIPAMLEVSFFILVVGLFVSSLAKFLLKERSSKPEFDQIKQFFSSKSSTSCEGLTGIRCIYQNKDAYTFSVELQKIMGIQADEDGYVSHDVFKNSIAADDRPKVLFSFDDERIKSGIYTSDYRVNTASGKEVVIHEVARVQYDNKGQPLGIIAICNNISGEIVSRVKSDLFDILFEHSNDGLILTDHNNQIIAINPAYTSYTGYTQDEVKGLDPKVFSSGRHDEKFYQNMWNELNKEDIWKGKIWDKKKNGVVFPKQLVIQKIIEPVVNQSLHLGMFIDLSIMEEYEGELSKLTYYDLLTNVYNRNYFYEKSLVLLKNSQKIKLGSAILYVEIRNLGELNRAHSMNCGDQALVSIAKFLDVAEGEYTIVSRFGGKTFVVLLTRLHGKNSVVSFVNSVNRSVGDGVECFDERLYPKITIGINYFEDMGDSIPLLVDRASVANAFCHESATSKNYLFYELGFDQKKNYLKKMAGRLREALDHDEIYLEYQPQFDLSKNTICGIEALARWSDSQTKKSISPMEFISVAEKTGQIKALGKKIIELGFSQLSIWRKEFAEKVVPLSINVSVLQLEDSHFADFVGMMLKKFGIAGNLVKLEVTENIFASDKEKIVEALTALRLLDLRISIDDFGTGFSGLSYFHDFPVDELKLDRSFVLALEKDDRVARFVIALANQFGVSVVVEGIEEIGQLAHIQRLGCDIMQGYLLSKPVASEKIDEILQSGGASLCKKYNDLSLLPRDEGPLLKEALLNLQEASTYRASIACIGCTEDDVFSIKASKEWDSLFLKDFLHADAESLDWIQKYRPDIVLLNVQDHLHEMYEKVFYASPDSICIVYSKEATRLKEQADPFQFIFNFIEKPAKEGELLACVMRAFEFRKEIVHMKKSSLKRTQLAQKRLQWMEWKSKSIDRQQIRNNISLLENIWISVAQGNGFGALTSILAMLESGVDKLGDVSHVDSAILDLVFDSSKESKKWIENLGKVIQIFSKKYELKTCGEVEFQSMVHGAIKSVEAFCAIKNHTIEFNATADFEFEVQLDQHAFEMVLRELLTNAMKYSPANTVISVFYYRSGKDLALRVTNRVQTTASGQEGIPESSEFLVLEPFFRLDKAVDDRYLGEELGLGIGLTVVKDILEQFNSQFFIHNVKDYSRGEHLHKVVSADVSIPIL